jgi:hypothetical protein
MAKTTRIYLSGGHKIRVSEDAGREILSKLRTTPDAAFADKPGERWVPVDQLGTKKRITICLQHVVAIEEAAQSELHVGFTS